MQRLILFVLILTAALCITRSEKPEKSSAKPAARKDRATPISAAELFKELSKSMTLKPSVKSSKSKGTEEVESTTAKETEGSQKSPKENVEATTSPKKTCKAFDVCYSNDDCHGGQCVGAFVGKCNCNACLDFWFCESDAACGGLKGACSNTTKTCDCNAGFKAAGYKAYVDALKGLCNEKKCTKDNADKECFGLPCHYGTCMCL
ncbi:hypothetical protein OESDEN_05648 [Oesophagostomum dentatum]|uniref:Chondroitin proteoglycan 3 n=1 Tax=Oesophagostomum dentatum TaxID=61180 RepID=A0A0B1TA21_OESDE|nr:hypothetical protein OESDEN_05648 [Oesophagostomum dentatum]